MKTYYLIVIMENPILLEFDSFDQTVKSAAQIMLEVDKKAAYALIVDWKTKRITIDNLK